MDMLCLCIGRRISLLLFGAFVYKKSCIVKHKQCFQGVTFSCLAELLFIIFSLSCGSLRVSGADVCEELRGRMIAVCCLYEVRLRGWGARMLGMEGRRYKLW